jgi:hypothetical protein
MQFCKLCLSPYEPEIKKALKMKMRKIDIFNKYAPLMNYKSGYVPFVNMIQRHRFHIKPDALIVEPVNVASNPVKKANFENLVKRITELGYAKVESMTPEDLSLRDVWSANKVLIDLKKQKLEENQMMMALARMFGPVIEGEEVLEKEQKELDGTVKLRDEGSQQTNSQ